jgi:hypothetical protein
MIDIEPYSHSRKDAWNALQKEACNSTLLHNRNYMDYHEARYKDASLMFFNNKNKLVALFPACLSIKASDTVVSHEGLTYGGLIVPQRIHSLAIEEIYEALVAFYKNEMHMSRLVVKPIPYIYSTQPCQEELYVITRQKGILTERHLSQAVELDQPFKTSQLRQRCIAKAQKAGVETKEAIDKEEWISFHSILTDVLKNRHNTAPVHTLEELWLLHSRFPHEVRLYIAVRGSRVLAGCVVYVSRNVIHTQYLASSPEGFETGALDIVLRDVLLQAKNDGVRYLDFGVSTERTGELNHGLALQKEGLGGRGVCYDTYLINL